jgi:hypothetical protein
VPEVGFSVCFTQNFVEVPPTALQHQIVMIWADYIAISVFALASACIGGLVLAREPHVRLDQIFGLCIVVPAVLAIPLWWGLRFVDWVLEVVRRRSNSRSKAELKMTQL